MNRLYLMLAALLLAPTLAQAQYVRTQEVFPAHRYAAPTEFMPVPGHHHKVAVAYQPGIIRIHNLDSVAALPKVMLDITSLTHQDGEMGLLGLAFHPRFPDTNKVYVNYINFTSGTVRNTVIASFRIDTATMTGTAASREILLTYNQPYTNHKGGKVQFGPDGMLYIAAGDGGSQGDPTGNGQNKRVLLAKIMRIDVDRQDSGLAYAIPPDNPFADSAAPIRREIYAYGFRNPWRFTWDAPTNRLWVADVGQDTWEEVDTVISGGNYGWKLREGKHCYIPPTNCDRPGLIDPVVEYRHTLGCSITGGYVYRGSAVPIMQDRYIYGDYCTGRMWGVRLQNGVADSLFLAQAHTVGTAILNICTFGLDDDGELYVLHQPTGAIFKIVADPTATKPALQSAGLAAYPNPALQSLHVEFTLSASAKAGLRLVDVSGRETLSLFASKELTAGKQEFTLPTEKLPTGTYILELETPAGRQRIRVAVVR